MYMAALALVATLVLAPGAMALQRAQRRKD
jgi:hypothetical protein